ncbi:hypothetical protein OPIT5_23895 [Opitutaceae bacterium TAV5]|nr:hypothetical protein OPIT5_23895 [Opitutaceae bacterium TAV5]
MKPLLTLCIATTLLASVATHAETIIFQDDFTTANGKAALLNTHRPATSINGTGWQFTSASDKPNTEPYIHQDGTVRTRFNGAGYVSLASTDAYTKPATLTLQADLTLNTLDGPAAAGAGIALGFYKATPLPRGNETTVNFLGLIIDQAGKLSLIDSSVTNAKKIHASVALPDFDATRPVTLRYTINTTTGGITNVTCDGADYTAAFQNVTGLFTDSATHYAAFLGRANSKPSASANVDNFRVTTAD